nr:hypothetical protein [Roseofilum sp. SID3]
MDRIGVFLAERSLNLDTNLKLSSAAVEHLEVPGLESGYSWLPSPGALSSPPGHRKVGNTRLEGWLKKQKILLEGEVLNPQLLEAGFGLPVDWTSPLECRAAMELLESEEQP